MASKKSLMILGFLGLTLMGTLGGNKGIPLLANERTGNSYGINLGLKNKFSNSAKHYGLNVGLISEFSEGSQGYGRRHFCFQCWKWRENK